MMLAIAMVFLVICGCSTARVGVVSTKAFDQSIDSSSIVRPHVDDSQAGLAHQANQVAAQVNGLVMVAENLDQADKPVQIGNIANCLKAGRDRQHPEARQAVCIAAEQEVKALCQDLSCLHEVTVANGNHTEKLTFQNVLTRSIVSAKGQKADRELCSFAFTALEEFCQITESCFDLVITAEAAAAEERRILADNVADTGFEGCNLRGGSDGVRVSADFTVEPQEIPLVTAIAKRVAQEQGMDIREIALRSNIDEARLEIDETMDRAIKPADRNYLKSIEMIINRTSSATFKFSPKRYGISFGFITEQGDNQIAKALYVGMTQAIEYRKYLDACAKWQADDGYEAKGIQCGMTLNYARMLAEPLIKAPELFENAHHHRSAYTYDVMPWRSILTASKDI